MIKNIVIDCADLERLTEFWSKALGFDRRPPEGQYSVLIPSTPGQPRLLLQQVAEPKTGKARIHLDLTSENLDLEVTRLVTLGASAVRAYNELGTRWMLMLDPEGNEFCVIAPT
jgi:predicted enzyme related to lactoylglutathione lyase